MNYNRLFLSIIILFVVWVAGCASSPPTREPLGLAERAAAEATVIVQRAEATAIVLKAQATANAMIQMAEVKQTPTPVAPTKSIPTTSLPTQTNITSSTPTSVANVDRNSQVEIVGVGFAADGGLIIVQFKAPPDLARMWNQTNVYVIDEATKTKYDDVPVTPLIGPLLGRPKFEGQLGYIMFYNTDAGIRPGSIVTVVFGDYKQEHLVVQQ